MHDLSGFAFLTFDRLLNLEGSLRRALETHVHPFALGLQETLVVPQTVAYPLQKLLRIFNYQLISSFNKIYQSPLVLVRMALHLKVSCCFVSYN